MRLALCQVSPPSPATLLFGPPPFPSLWHRLTTALIAIATLVLSWLVAVVPVVAAPRKPLVLLWFPFPFRTCT
jgi:hypothetical protein